MLGVLGVSQPDLRIQHFNVASRCFVRENADAGLRAVGPRRFDDRPRLLLDHRGGFALEAIEIPRLDDARRFELRRVGVDRVARRPVFVQLAVRVSVLGKRRVFP